MPRQASAGSLPEIRVPAGLTLAGLAAGLALGLILQGSRAGPPLLAIAGPVGDLWLQALKMTILPLVVGLLFTGIVRAVASARAGAMARRTLGLFVLILAAGAAIAALVMPLLLDLAPARGSLATLGGAEGDAATVPGFADFLASLIPANVVAAAAGDAILAVIVFTALFALASTRLADEPREQLAGFFEALAAAMMVLIGWVLAAAPVGVLALGFRLAANSGAAAIGALAHYIVAVAAIGAVVLLAAYILGGWAARGRDASFATAVLPAQAVAVSTQSSLASLPAMLVTCRRLGVSETNSEFVLPLAVALFRATGPAMNVAVAFYAAQLAGIELTGGAIIAGVLVATLTTFGTVSLPGTVSFIASVGPVAVAMGVPVEPLAILVAVEMLPDIMRTVGNVTMDVAVTVVIDRKAPAPDGQ